jgi:lipid II:glycine glycyltransferase (peptidoglycan interpeptide bridge formation enzyme)
MNLEDLSISLEAFDASEASKLDQAGDVVSFMQSGLWASFKIETGWKAYICRIETQAHGFKTYLVVLLRPLVLGFIFAYIPHGPTTTPNFISAGAFIERIADSISKHLGRKVLFIRFDLPWLNKGNLKKEIFESGMKLFPGLPVQVPDTVILDIADSEEDILSRMKPKWRYNIKLAQKKGVSVRDEGKESLDIFYELYQKTAVRDGISIHPLTYYRALFDCVENWQDSNIRIKLFVARHEAEALAAIITIHYKGRATYLYGASSSEKRNLMPAYALQWAAIQAAKTDSCVEYDFFGIPPDDNPDHPLAGLYLFKTGFGGRVVNRIGSVDFLSRPFLYRIFRLLETSRIVWHKSIKKKIHTLTRPK